MCRHQVESSSRPCGASLCSQYAFCSRATTSCVRVRVHIRVRVCVCECMCVCACGSHARTPAYRHTKVYIKLASFLRDIILVRHGRMSTHACMHAHTHTHTHTHTYTHTRAHDHEPVRRRPRALPLTCTTDADTEFSLEPRLSKQESSRNLSTEYYHCTHIGYQVGEIQVSNSRGRRARRGAVIVCLCLYLSFALIPVPCEALCSQTYCSSAASSLPKTRQK